MSENRENFKRLGVKRVERVIKYIRLLGNLSNKTNYTYSEADVEKIFSEIEKELELCRQRFEIQKRRSNNVSFTLDD